MIETITLTGGLPRDAVIRYTTAGHAVAEFTIAQSDRKYNEQSQQWEDVRNLYLDVTIWNENKQNNPIPWAELAETLSKGDKVAVTGKLHTRQWQEKDGSNRSKVQFLASAFYVIGTQLNAPQSQTAQQSPPSNGGWGQQAPKAAAWDKQPAQPAHPAGRAGDADEPPF